MTLVQPPTKTEQENPTLAKRTFFMEHQYTLVGPLLIRPAREDLRVQHMLEIGDRIAVREESERGICIETRRTIEGGRILKGVFLLTRHEWGRFLNAQSSWREVVVRKK
jgi:hypothetical protein